MTLFIADGHDAQLPAYDWREVAMALRRRRHHNVSLIERIESSIAPVEHSAHVRIRLTDQEIQLVDETLTALGDR